MNELKAMLVEARKVELDLYPKMGRAFDMYLYMLAENIHLGYTAFDLCNEWYKKEFLALVPEIRALLNKQLEFVAQAVRLVGEPSE